MLRGLARPRRPAIPELLPDATSTAVKQQKKRTNTRRPRSQRPQPPAPKEGGTSLFERIEAFLFKPIDIAPIVYFRIIFGAIMFWEVTRYYSHDWIERYYIDPTFFFKYYGFSWIHPLPDNLMYVFFLCMGVLCVFIILGLWYRVSAVLFWLGFTYWFLLDQANYLNHFYLISLVSFLMIFVPAHRNASLDVVRKPELRVATVPAWTRWLLIAQLGIAYFFGGVAKINSDWLQGEPMRSWLAGTTDFPFIGHLFTEPWAAYFFSYGGLLFDLMIVPLLLWKRTRVIAVVMALSFHLMNDNLFSIGIFPWFMIFATPLFFEPFRLRPVLKLEKVFQEPVQTRAAMTMGPDARRLVVALFCAYFAVQVLMPFRHHLYPGNVNWTEEGHNFSWHMKLRDKGGRMDLVVTNPDTGATWVVDQTDFLSRRQRRKMRSRPDMVVRFAHALEDHYKQQGLRRVIIRAQSAITLNGRPPQPLIDPTVDLTQVEVSLLPAPWILPLTIPLR